MIYRIEISKRARLDVEEIYEYIAFTLMAQESALKQLDRLERSIRQLNQMPRRFRVYDTEPWRSRGLRTMTVDKFVVLYVPDDEKKTVTVIRVLYGGRDIDKEMREYTSL